MSSALEELQRQAEDAICSWLRANPQSTALEVCRGLDYSDHNRNVMFSRLKGLERLGRVTHTYDEEFSTWLWEAV